MTTNVGKKEVKQKPLGKDEKVKLCGVQPREIENGNGQYQVEIVPERDFEIKGANLDEPSVEIQAYKGSIREKNREQETEK